MCNLLAGRPVPRPSASQIQLMVPIWHGSVMAECRPATWREDRGYLNSNLAHRWEMRGYGPALCGKGSDPAPTWPHGRVGGHGPALRGGGEAQLQPSAAGESGFSQTPKEGEGGFSQPQSGLHRPPSPGGRSMAQPHPHVGVGVGGMTWPTPAPWCLGFENLAAGENGHIYCHCSPATTFSNPENQIPLAPWVAFSLWARG